MNDLDRLAADTRSSASLLLGDAIRVLREARAAGRDALTRAAVGVCRAQPAMGAFWNAAAAALAPDDDLLNTFETRARRAPSTIARLAVDLLTDDDTNGPLRIITCSRSAMIEACIRALADQREVIVACAEGRPGMEGQALAGALSSSDLRVELFTDAAIASAFAPGAVVLVGADAVAPGWFINKAGTGQLCASALVAGISCYAVTGREKFVVPAIADRLQLREGDPREVLEWDATLVAVRNPLFERVPLDRVAGVLTDAGLLAGDMIAAACESSVGAAQASALIALMDLAGAEPA